MGCTRAGLPVGMTFSFLISSPMVETIKVRIAEYSHRVNQSRENYSEPDSSLESSKLNASLYDEFEPSYFARPDLYDVMMYLNSQMTK